MHLSVQNEDMKGGFLSRGWGKGGGGKGFSLVFPFLNKIMVRIINCPFS